MLFGEGGMWTGAKECSEGENDGICRSRPGGRMGSIGGVLATSLGS
jgi:hypothetical protein